MQHCLTLFGSDQQGPSLQALLLIRQMALLLPDPALDLALKVPAASNCQLLHKLLQVDTYNVTTLPVSPPPDFSSGPCSLMISDA